MTCPKRAAFRSGRGLIFPVPVGQVGQARLQRLVGSIMAVGGRPDGVSERYRISSGGGSTASYYCGRNFLYLLAKLVPAATLRAHARAIARAQWGFTRESLRPYAVGGLAWMHASAANGIDFEEFSNDFLGLSLGVGAVGFIGDVTGLRFDLRYLKSISSSDTSNLSGDIARISFWRATIGVVFR